VMSRETSLLVLESQAMFDAFGVDRSSPAATWTGEEEVDEVAASGTIPVPADIAPGKKAATASAPRAEKARMSMDFDGGGDFSANTGSGRGGGGVRAEPATKAPAPSVRWDNRRMMIPMKRVWTRQAALANFDGASPSITKAITDAEAALAANPDSREKHRALVQALAYAGKLDEAHDIANRWRERDKLDPQALGYIADIIGRDGKRELALRTLAGLVDLDPDRANLHERMVNAYERSGRVAQACSHRIALVALNTKEAAKRAGAAARCLRTLGRTDDANLVMASLVDDKARTEAEKLATVSPIEPRVAGDLVIAGRWDNNADLDISLVAPDGTRVSWMGGRTDITVADSTASDREQLSVKRLKKGNYLIEISRGEATTTPIRGTLDVSVLGQKKALPFELTGARTVVGSIKVTMHSHLEPVNPGDARFLRQGWQNRPDIRGRL
jgi:tetratricopeptide (TPR) repeat protein